MLKSRAVKLIGSFQVLAVAAALSSLRASGEDAKPGCEEVAARAILETYSATVSGAPSVKCRLADSSYDPDPYTLCNAVAPLKSGEQAHFYVAMDKSCTEVYHATQTTLF